MAVCPIPIPKDSLIRAWVDQFDNTEVWWSWRIATALGMIGAALKRDCFFDMGQAGKIWPNCSIMLIGESGDGKDTIIRPAENVMRDAGVKQIPGKTIEAIKHYLCDISSEDAPAVGYIAAKELAEFLGTKDYQKGMMESLTDLLTSNEWVDVTLRSDLRETRKPRIIYKPTLTVFAGTTADWLTGSMPEGTLEGGFLGRFLVMAETGNKIDQGIHPVPNPGKYQSEDQKSRVLSGMVHFNEFICGLPKWISVETKGRLPYEIAEDPDAEMFYNNWYANRFEYYTKSVRAYANRAAHIMRKVALLCAVSRHELIIHEDDYRFAAGLMERQRDTIKQSILNVSREVKAGYAILPLLPAKQSSLIRELSEKWGPLWVKRGIIWLVEAGYAEVVGGVIIKSQEDNASSPST